jgi:hypothetical protein
VAQRLCRQGDAFVQRLQAQQQAGGIRAGGIGIASQEVV